MNFLDVIAGASLFDDAHLARRLCLMVQRPRHAQNARQLSHAVESPAARCGTCVYIRVPSPEQALRLKHVLLRANNERFLEQPVRVQAVPAGYHSRRRERKPIEERQRLRFTFRQGFCLVRAAVRNINVGVYRGQRGYIRRAAAPLCEPLAPQPDAEIDVVRSRAALRIRDRRADLGNAEKNASLYPAGSRSSGILVAIRRTGRRTNARSSCLNPHKAAREICPARHV